MKNFQGKAYALRGVMFRGSAVPTGTVLACKENEMMLLAESGRAELFDPTIPAHAAALAKAAKHAPKPAEESDEPEPPKKK
jgi:hypothetical protein